MTPLGDIYARFSSQGHRSPKRAQGAKIMAQHQNKKQPVEPIMHHVLFPVYLQMTHSPPGGAPGGIAPLPTPTTGAGGGMNAEDDEVVLLLSLLVVVLLILLL